MSDLTRKEVLRIAERIDRALQRRPVLPTQSLQYRLGEVGNQRVHPHALRRVLRSISRPLRSKRAMGQELQPWTPYPNLYVAPSLSASEALAAAEHQREAIKSIATADWGEAFDLFVEAIQHHIGPVRELSEPKPENEAVPLAGDITIGNESRILRHEGAGISPIHIWITQDPRWIHADDHRLWAFLASCLEVHAMPLIIARLIDPATFPLFKALGVRGIQYYGMWSTQQIRESLQGAATELGWFYLNNGEEASEHRIFEQLHNSIKLLSGKTLEPHVSKSIQAAIELGLAASGSDTTNRLLTWAKSAPLPLPDQWLQTVQRWITWQNTNLEQRSKLSRKNAARIRPPLPADSRPQDHQPPTTSVDLAPATDDKPHGYARKTTVTRIPLRLR